ncbi:MAG TPA: shikimate dehydrogenase [Pyrinomonadaceae bacterium]|nr:shikimate dehydrogenase [Pyrinomonadaceae bacterium]
MADNKRTRVCVPVCEKDLAALQKACEQATEWADIIELRLDCLREISEDAASQLTDFARPLILTFRPTEQGGYRDSTRAERETFWHSIALQIHSDWWDLEGDLVDDLSLDWSRIIISHHDFTAVPNDLEQIYEQLAGTPAAVVKIAVQANDIIDCLPVFHLLDRARTEGRELIAIAMGNAGIATRILGPSRGSFLTYGAIDDESGTAPGQVNARKLRSLYHIDKIDGETMICGLVGLPVMHSVSPHVHNTAFMSEGINGVYLPFEVRDANEFFTRMVHPLSRELNWNLRGLSITAPHKQTVMECLDWIDPKAEEIGAVNTVVIDGDRLLGYNTDAAGFIEPLHVRFGSLRGAKVAIIGAGGAARAAAYALREQNAVVTLFARDVGKAQPLAEYFDLSCELLQGASFAGYDFVINATPLGSGAHIDQSPATEQQLQGVRCVYDLIYNPRETKLLRAAVAAGCETLGGLEMLVAQAKLQFELWTGKKPSTSAIQKALQNVL